MLHCTRIANSANFYFVRIYCFDHAYSPYSLNLYVQLLNFAISNVVLREKYEITLTDLIVIIMQGRNFCGGGQSDGGRYDPSPDKRSSE